MVAHSPSPQLFFTYREAAAACRLSESMIRKLVRSQRLKVVKFGRCVRIPIDELIRSSTSKAEL
jgi:excisionase family DNA binding protein